MKGGTTHKHWLEGEKPTENDPIATLAAAMDAMRADIAALRQERHSRESAAVRTLERLGYTHTGGVEWRPPVGKAPDFNLLDAKNAQITALLKAASTKAVAAHMPAIMETFGSVNLTGAGAGKIESRADGAIQWTPIPISEMYRSASGTAYCRECHRGDLDGDGVLQHSHKCRHFVR